MGSVLDRVKVEMRLKLKSVDTGYGVMERTFIFGI